MVVLTKINDMAKKIQDTLNVKMVLMVFVFISLVYLDLPGLYLDAVNPDYMGLHILHSDNVSEWAYSDNVIMTKIEGNEAYSHYPILNSLYGTCYEAYTMLMWSVPFGWGVYAIRTSHILYFVILLLGIYFLLKYVCQNKNVATIGTLLLSIEPALVLNTRTQFYIQLFPYVFFGFGLLFFMRYLFDVNRNERKLILSGILLGLSASSYFVFAFYFVGIFIVLITLMHKKKDSWIRKGMQLIMGFVVGFMPYIYAHISIMMTQGIDGWIAAIKGLDTYGLSDGAAASFVERVLHISERMGNVVGGASVVSLMTGRDIGATWGKVVAIIYVVCVGFSLLFLISKRREIWKSREAVFLLILDNIFIWHCILALVVGNALGYQHFIMLLPIMYLTILIFAKQMKDKLLIGTSPKVLMGKVAMFGCVFVLLVMSLSKNMMGYRCIRETGGVGYYSEAINDMGYYLNSAVGDEDTIISPQWGYWMQIACITSGEKTIWIDSEINTLQWRMDSIQQSGRYFVIIDNNTDREMIEMLMENNSYEKTDVLTFNDHGSVLSPEIWLYSRAQE